MGPREAPESDVVSSDPIGPTSPSTLFLRNVARGVEPEPREPDLGAAASRFQLLRRIGAGGFGVVYEALDRQHDAHVALKVLARSGGRALYGFKREFRALAGLVHENLVRLHELHGEASPWFFTMELVRGEHALAHVRGDPARLRSVFVSIAEGLCFFHDTGRVHCDVKPSNVLVEPGGRVVLLDFGLAVELDDHERPVAGTPAYMAPELRAGAPLAPAVDWYATGVMLHQCLTGQLPPARWNDDAPADLRALCEELLHPDPAARPAGREVLTRLAPGRVAPAPAAPRSEVFVGRAPELAALRQAFATARDGRTAIALVRGRSGIGKSALLGRFSDELREREPGATLLASRCFEQETMPFNAVDGLVDAAAARLLALPDAEAALPADVDALARQFPSLRRVPAVAARAGERDADALVQRRRAFAALRELLGGLAAHGPLAIFVDDLQWGDADSAALLAELLGGALPLLAVLAYRDDEADRGECLRDLVPSLRGAVDVPVGELAEDEARELARLESRAAERAESIARESGGHPLFVRELCRGEARPGVTLDDALAARVAALGDDARRLLEIAAVAGRPIERAAAVRAAGLGDDGPSHLGVLREGRLLRLRADRSRDEIEPYHDRVREAILARIAPQARRGHHLALARALLAGGRGDAEALALHFHEGGEPARAAEHWLDAADQALDALGFDRAARLYRQGIDALPDGDARRAPLHEKLGLALGNAQRGPEAAAAYLVAAAAAGGAHGLDLRRRAAEHYLTSGRTESGFAALDEVLAAVGLSMPKSTGAALLRTLPYFFAQRFRGLVRHERAASEVPAEELLRVDVCAGITQSVAITHPVTAMHFHHRAMHFARRAGEPHRLVRSLVYERMTMATVGHSETSAYERRLEQKLEDLVARHGDPGSIYATMKAVVTYLRGRPGEACAELARVDAALWRRGGLGADVALARIFWIEALLFGGDWAELDRRYAELTADARERGNLYLEVALASTAGHAPGLAADRPAEARAAVERVERTFRPADDYHAYCRMLALGMTALYEDAGAGGAALELVTARWPSLVRSRLLRMSRILLVRSLFLRGAAGLAAAAAGPARRDLLLRGVDRDARAIARARARGGAPFAACLRACAAAARGRREEATALLAVAEAGFGEFEMALHAAAAARRRGELEDDGARMAAADAAMAARGITNPARLAAALVPGII